jgi:hypothetical protein
MAGGSRYGRRSAWMEAARQGVPAGDRAARGMKVVARYIGKVPGGLLLTADSARFRGER